MKQLFLIQIRGKLKSFGCEIEAGKLVFDFANDRTLIFDSEEKEIRRQNSIEPKVKSIFVPLLAKKKKSALNVLVMGFDFTKKILSFEGYFADGTKDGQTL